MMRVARGLRGGLQEVADDLGVSPLPLPKSAAQLTRVLHLNEKKILCNATYSR